ncbi:hypothetical protein QVD17_06259 [Tagetes erecta]|uniref:C2H2-type domain-containing protein n=1 Tax=Tagetes erecta TaxID=13708 RepID=A0AAD8PC39_TARER|nr:hypothetical protein QVD17_06259 [Tagetes erecta]
MTGTKNQDDKNVENFVRENTRMIVQHSIEQPNSGNRPHYRIYKCKDCDKEYDSFQALGGHRAGHRNTKPQTLNGESSSGVHETQSNQKLHACKICNKGFEIGQSLGGHMRKHWRKKAKIDHTDVDSCFSSCSSSSSAVVTGSNVEWAFKYDLNLTPYENESINGVQEEEEEEEDFYQSS